MKAFLSLLKANPLVAGLIGIALVAAIVAYFTFADRREQRIEEKLEEKGAVTERAKQSEAVINRVEEANNEREKISRNDDAGAQLRYEQCLRSARTPANCQRLLPERPAN